MPLVRIALRKGKSPEYRRALSDSIHRAMVDAVNVPEQDRFQVITEHDESGLIYDSSYLGISRTSDVVLIQITLNAGRSVDLRKALFARIVQYLRESPGVRPEDVFINVVEVPKENWSFGNGIAQYA